MCQINPSSPYNFAQESDAVRRLREQLTIEGSGAIKKQDSVIKDPQNDAVKELMKRISLGQV